MTKLIMCLLMSICLLSCSSSDKPHHFEDSANKYSVEIPANWEQITDRDVSLVLGNISGDEVIVIDAEKEPTQTLENWYNEKLAQVTTLNQFKMESHGDTTIDGQPAKWLSYTYNKDGADIVTTLYGIQKADTYYKILYLSTVKNVDAEKDYDNLVKGIKFLK